MAGATPGPHPKGGVRTPVRLPDEHAAKYRELAAARGMSLSDFIAASLARYHQLDAPDWLRRHDHDEENTLPLGIPEAA